MGFFDFLGLNEPDNPQDRVAYVARQQDMEEELHYMTGRMQELEEDLLKISDAFDNVGWSPLEAKQAKEMDLDTIKKVSEVARAMLEMNPFIKSGVTARIGYIWGKGVEFEKVEAAQANIDLNYDKLFSPQALAEREKAAAADGNVFTALPVGDDLEDDERTAVRIPLHQIAGVIANPDDPEEVWFYLREWTVPKTNLTTGITREEPVKKYYPSIAYYQRIERQGRAMPRNRNKVGVEQRYVLMHETVNKQIGWRWGVPDIMPVIYWAKAYKEYLEDNAMLVKAYSRLAWQIKAPNMAAAQAASAQVMAPPTRDPITGELRRSGASAITGLGTELSPTGTNGSQVDFTKGSPLASAIAAGLEVPQAVIVKTTGDAGSNAAEKTLDLPTLKAMETRQKLWGHGFEVLFRFWGSEEAEIVWPQIETDTTKDRVAALVQATRDAELLYPEEARKELISIFGIVPIAEEVPSTEDFPWKQYEQEQAELGFQREQEAAKVVAAQGVQGGTASKGGAMNTNNSARNNRASDSNNS